MKTDVIVTSFNNPKYDRDLLEQELGDITFSPLCNQQKSTDSNKIAELERVLNNSNDVILSLRGGAGCPRLMSSIRFPETISDKVLVGYSDLTVLLNYLVRYQNIRVIHGPMAFELTNPSRIDKYQLAISGSDIQFDKPGKWLVEQNITGKVVGGNLMLVVDSIGTFYEVDTDDKILLLEEIDEPITKLDRMLTQLRDSGKFDNLRGIILGQFTDCEAPEEQLELFKYYFANLGIGVIYDLNLGHIDDSDYIELYRDLTVTPEGISYHQ